MAKKQKHEEKNTFTYLVIGPMDIEATKLHPYKDHDLLRLIFIDGGLRHQELMAELYPIAIRNSLSLGDGDSSKEVMNIHKTDQNISDLGFFLNSKEFHGCASSYLFFGFLGGRLDHMLFNFGELTKFTRNLNSNNILVMLDDQIQFLCKGENLICIDGAFSIAGLGENKIKINGECEYTTDDWISLGPLSSRGLSNFGRGAVLIESQGPLFILYS